jgi:hypothetical protein
MDSEDIVGASNPSSNHHGSKDEEAQNKRRNRKESGYLLLSSSLPITNKTLLFVQRWFLYGKRTTVGFFGARM